jgi:hypothetical protein
MNQKNFILIASLIFLTIGIVQSFRVFFEWEIKVGNFITPMWMTYVVVILAFYLSFTGFRLAKKV